MFDRIQKSFLTVDTGEAYQPVRLTYALHQKDSLLHALENLHCVQKSTSSNTWNWYWKDECENLQFASLESFRKTPAHPVRIGTITLTDDKFFLNLPSFKRACLLVPFLEKHIPTDIAQVQHADFINKVFALDDRFPHHGFTEMFDDMELEHILQQRIEDYEKVKAKCEEAESAEEAFVLLAEYTKKESQKRLPYAERYFFQFDVQPDPEIVFLAFYIFLRSREIVAIKRWHGQAGYNLADATDETIEQVFGSINLDALDK